MPTYDFQCDACNHTFEEYQSMMDKPLKKCPKCKKNRLRRLIGTGAAIIFKGSGFYQTDYRSESYKTAAKAEAKETDSKPAGDGPAKAGDKPVSGDKPSGASEKTASNGAKESTTPAASPKKAKS